MICLEFVLNLHNMQHQELAEKLGIKKQNIHLWIKKKQNISKKYLPILSEMFGIPEEMFQKELLTEEDKIEIHKLKIRNDIKNDIGRRDVTEKVQIKSENPDFNEKEFWGEFRKELENDEEYIEQERKEQFKKLLTALDYFEGHEIMADTINGFMTYQVYGNFTYSLFTNAKGDYVVDLKDEEESTPSIGFKVDEIEFVEIDDNNEFIESGEMDHYEADNIVITLNNGSILRLEFQW